MKQGIITATLILVWVALGAGPAQGFFTDDFDDGDMNGWSVVQFEGYEGDADIDGTYFHSPDFALRARRQGFQARTVVQRDGYLAASAIYEAWYYMADTMADADLYFQFMDPDNCYWVSAKPLGTDNPGVDLIKRVAGVQTTLAHAEANFHLGEWVHVMADRGGAGHISVFINGDHVFTRHDGDLLEPGGFCVGSWQDAWIDDVSVVPGPVPMARATWGEIKSLYR